MSRSATGNGQVSLRQHQVRGERDVEKHVWVAPDADADAAAGWLVGGSYLVARRFNMNIEIWDRQTLGDQEDFVGRTKDSGAPLSGGTEFTEPDFTMPGSTGPIIPVNAHIRLVHPDFNDGARMLRRGYNFVDGSNPLGGLDAGEYVGQALFATPEKGA